MAGRPGFMMYFDLAPALSKLTDEEAGMLFKAIMDYASTGEVQNLPGICDFAFEVIRPRIDKDREAYEETCRKNNYIAYIREAKRKGNSYLEYDEWLTNSPSVHSGNQALPSVHSGNQASPSVHSGNQLNSTTTQQQLNSTTTQIINNNNDNGLPYSAKVGAVMSDYLNRINPAASPMSLEELQAYAEDLGADVCKRAFDIALDNKKTTWPYIRAILQDKQAQGVRSLADWDALDAEREKRNSRKGGAKNGICENDPAPGDRIGNYI